MVLPDTVRDSRRLTGPNLVSDRPAAVLDVDLPPGSADEAVRLWRDEARRALEALGWGSESLIVRQFPGGASLALTAPIDALYAATEVNEWAFEATNALLGDREVPSIEENAARLRERIAAERNPRLIALRNAADVRGVSFLTDGQSTSVGLGQGALSFPTGNLPAVDDVDWSKVHDVPVCLVTGTNGKSTTVRLLGSIARAADRVAGLSSTDWIRVDGQVVKRGDYSGPEGARRVLRDKRVELAVLETARGGILRRGLAVRRADAALITNVAEDHLGEWGVQDVPALVETKFVVARALASGGTLVLNADDPAIVERARTVDLPIAWFGLDSRAERIQAALRTGATAAFLENDELVLASSGERIPLVRVDELSFALDGAARHNIANALGASALAYVLRVPPAAIARGLAAFESNAEENPGRLNLFEFGGARVLADFAHNPHGLSALIAMTETLSARRKLVILGQAGDRSDESIRELAQIAWRCRPDRVVVKEMSEHLRGRKAGEVPTLLVDELERLGAPRASIERAPSEYEAVESALAWAEPGDLLLFLLHAERERVLALLKGLQERGWKPGGSLR
jgi:UDP-N-acetylmuramyl tripeptide synthase